MDLRHSMPEMIDSLSLDRSFGTTVNTRLKMMENVGRRETFAHVLDLTEQAACLMETTGIGLESITRRRFLAEMLDIPPILLGLAEMPQRKTDDPIVSIVNKSGAIDLASYEMQLHSYYNTHHRRASYEHLLAIQSARR